MELTRKLEILADAAKYDASCASSDGAKRHSLGGPAGAIGSTEGAGICHSYAPDGRCISLLKILLTNWCVFDCLYCVNRESSNVPRARFTTAEVVQLTLDFYRRNVIEGLFLSSGIVRSPDETMEQVIEVARCLREDHHSRGCIHLKTIPNASEDLIARAGRYADRLSINVGLPTTESLAASAPQKSATGIKRSMARIRLHLDDAADARRARATPRSLPDAAPRMAAAPRFAPAGQSTQMIVGASAPAVDDGEALWLAHYSSIFNPARLKLAMMKREMPVRFWSNLPEAASIGHLATSAAERTTRMLQEASAPRARRRRTACDTQARGNVGTASLAQQCTRCEFAAQATQMVWGEGAHGAALMLVGEQPGDREDLEGRPFVGPAGRLLREAIASLGWPQAQLCLTNAVKHFKFEWRGKRRMHKTAVQREAPACADWLEAEIEQVKPRAIVALGATAARSLLGRSVPINEHTEHWLQRSDGRPVLVLQHPAALLRAASMGPPAPASLHAAWVRSLSDAARYLPVALARP
jgi:uracil-DNA glycosylase family protein